MPIYNSEGIGIDIGSMYTTIFTGAAREVALREPTLALVGAGDSHDVFYVGKEARAYLGRTSRETMLVSAVEAGAVADVELAALIMVALGERATGRKKPMDRMTLVCGLSGGATAVDRAALFQAMNATGAKRVAAVRTPAAACIGADVDISKSRGVMILSVGASITEIAVLSMNSIVALRRIYYGGRDMDDAIARWVWRKKQMVISMRTAEQLKREVGTLSEDAIDEDEEPVLLKGRDALTGAPASRQVSALDIMQSLQEPTNRIIDTMRDALYNVPAELSNDIREGGLILSGGGALLTGFKERLKSETGLEVRMSPHPQDDVAIGLGAAAGNEKMLRDLIRAGSAEATGE